MMRCFNFIKLIMVAFLLSGSIASAWFDCNWYYRSEVVITELTGSNLTDYQVLVEITAADMHADYDWSSVGQDLRVLDSNDLTEIEYYIQTWNAATKTARIWVKVPLLPASSNKTIYFYHGNTAALTTSTATITFTEPGIKFHTRNSTANPNNKAAAFNFFNAATDGVPGYGCKFITNFTNISNKNQFTPSTNMNFGAYSETFFEVKPSEVGLWSVRYGADFGRGGALFVDGVALEEDWNNDLWWAGNWGHADVLQGSISLSAGHHQLEIIGFEGCCDGGLTVQFRKPGGAYQTYSTANIDILSRKCPTIEPTTAFSTKTFFPPSLNISKTSEVRSDPVNLTNTPKRIVGARIEYSITVTNSGSPIDVDSIHIKDPVPANTSLQLANGDFTFSEGSPASGLSFVYSASNNSADNVSFSKNDGTDYTFQPVIIGNNTNSLITNFQLSPSGRFGCSNTTQPTQFTLKYNIIIN